MERRRLLHAGAGLVAASVVGPALTPARALARTAEGTGAPGASPPANGAAAAGTPGPCSDQPVSTYGTATYTAAIVGMTVLGGHAYVVARGQNPPLLGEIELGPGKLTRTVRLARGEGGWAATVSGGQVYVGTYPVPDLYRFDPATGAVTRLGTIGPSGGFVWCLTTAPDGTVYAGTYPRGEVWEYSPATGELRNLGVARPGEQYVRAIAADDRHVYAGTLPRGHVVVYDRSTGAKGSITPAPYGGAACLLARGGRVIGGFGRSVVDLAPDGSDARVIPMPAAERLVDAITSTGDGTVYCVGRPTGTVYRRDGDALVPVAAPTPQDEHRALFPLPDGRLLGGAGSGRVWWLDPNGGGSTTLELIDTAMAGPDPVQSLALGPGGTVHVGGHFSITTHRPAQGTSRRIPVSGEPKQLRTAGGRVYAALYPSTEVLELDPDRGTIRSLGFIGNDQQRPTDMRYARTIDRFLIASAPPAGRLKGALTVADRARGRLAVYHDVITDQSVMSLALDDRLSSGIAYLAGDTWGGGSVPPARPSATVAAFDLCSRTVLWEVAPLEGYASLQHIEVLDGVLYGVYKRLAGAWFAMDLRTRTVLRSGRLPSYGELTVHRGQVFASVFGGLVYRIGPDLDEAQPVLSGLGDGWYNPPQLAWEQRPSWHAWGVAGRELARLRLDPDCTLANRAGTTPPDAAVLESLLAN
ncbi:PQQ-like beta-propeller repeat protein [Streptomyces pacificus]|uniref:Uncharacterized protein n=1 Tax=Streptomyces pacificus TaxID=2705029 RepID=A0A6A0AQE7_9ACTN|nr:PQQ-like beta-propeller repeat protein [Streptomyces pacificus]GFH34533.1 hypothetical protein SCWH03_07470 [Streptomyces pacificus]